jgi:hypothetical protein
MLPHQQEKESTTTLNEYAMSILEEHIPELADVTFKQAYWAALASGSSVLVNENGNLVGEFYKASPKCLYTRA